MSTYLHIIVVYIYIYNIIGKEKNDDGASKKSNIQARHHILQEIYVAKVIGQSHKMSQAVIC